HDNTHSRYTGDTTLGFLNGRWAPGSTYTNKIVLYANEIWQGTSESGVETVTANAGSDLTADVGEEATFDASGSIISPLAGAGTISYSWDWDGDGVYDVTTENSVVKHTYDSEGTFNVKLEVTAFENIKSTDTVAVNINAYPTAIPGGPYQGTVNQELTFDGSASIDTDGTIIEYAWDFGDNSTGTGVKPVHTYTIAGTYTATLAIKDDKQASSITEQTTVTITDEEQEQGDGEEEGGETAENIIPVANPGGPYQGIVSEAITFNGSASADSDGTITEYLWDFGDGSSGSGVNPVHTYDEPGTYIAKLIVKDDKNAESTTVQVNITISEEEDSSENEGVVSNSTSVVGYKPVTVDQLVKLFENRNSNKVLKARILAILYIQIGSLFNIRADIAYAQMCYETGFLEYTGDVKPEQNNFCGMGAVGGGAPGNSFTSPKMGVIAHYAHLSWYYYQNHKNQYCSSQYDPRHDNTHSRYTGDTTLGFLNGRWAPGSTYTNKIVLYANEIWQGPGEGGVETITVNAIPTASPGGPYTATAGTEIILDGSASTDSDGTITEYNWNFGDNSTGTGARPTHIYAAAGTYTVTLTVKDNNGASSDAKTTTVAVTAASSGQSYPVNTTPISNSTSVIGYTEVTVDQLVKIFTDRGSGKVDWARRIAPIYINYGKLFNIRADIAWAQMCHETGFLEYTGDVQPNQNNFCGMGATGGGVPGNSFASEELGIIAHYAHLSWYYYPDHINNYCNSQYDPRHFGSSHYKYTGNTTLGFLNGNWAPGSTYTAKIILFANGIYGF
ncbi:MAG: PKD domain-containing protein, partial [Actinomycetota bacterium]